MITRDEIKTLADLARLSLSDEQCGAYEKDFQGVLGYIDTLNSVEVSSSTQKNVLTNTVREDDDFYEPGAFTELLINEAPQSEQGYIKVAKIL